ncbi:MAG: dienelactone hydrolase [Betaproteobacteria bacterium RIFCSPLOWO2_12_FULL_66_14]|nr:MAG: dienelactone hydrolase [Betaproteobacteria bacterium RIFCSPLOWO2_12_FULL_66_14]
MKAEAVDYKEGSTGLEGWVAYDDAKPGKRPGVLLFSDWTGVGDYAKKRAAMLVDLGYAVFCADVYGKGVRPSGQDPQACTAEMMKYLKDRPLLRSRAKAGLEQLKALPVVDSKVGAIGYCFGGLCGLELARTGADIAGIVGFHCNLNTPNPADAKNIKAKVLVLNGADDPVVPDSETQAFEKEMRDAKVDWQLVRYGNTVHGYTQWYIPPGGNQAAYYEPSDKRSWVAMQSFFKEIFGG